MTGTLTNGATMTRITPLLERNEQFARAYTPAALGPPAAQMLIVTCLDHRVDPAVVLGLRLGDAPVIRNAGGRVTPAVIDDIAFLAFLAEQLFSGQLPGGTLFEVAVVHHTQCGTGFLADPAFRHQAAEATGLSEAAMEAAAVADPYLTVKADVERLLTSPLLSPKVSVSGHVYDIATGRVTTTLDARFPALSPGRPIPGSCSPAHPPILGITTAGASMIDGRGSQGHLSRFAASAGAGVHRGPSRSHRLPATSRNTATRP